MFTLSSKLLFWQTAALLFAWRQGEPDPFVHVLDNSIPLAKIFRHKKLDLKN